MPSTRFSRNALRAALLAATAFGAAVPALAADRPATQQGADKILDFFTTYFGKAIVTPPALISVKPDGAAYALSADLATLTAAFKSAGFSYDPAPMTYKLAEQDDGLWRLSQDGMPKIVSHFKDGSSAMEFTNVKQEMLIDPAIGWFRSGKGGADKGWFEVHQPGVDQTIGFGAVQATYSSTSGAGGVVSSVVNEEIADIDVKVTATPKEGEPTSVSGRVDNAKIGVTIDGLKARKALDLWAFVVAHPSRPDLAGHEPELKGLIREVAVGNLALSEDVAAEKAVIESPIGAIVLASAKFGFGVATGGPKAGLEYRLAADGLSLPAGLLPPNAADLTPRAFDLAIKVGGVNVAAAIDAALAGLHLQGEGPPISDADGAKVMAAFVSGGPMTVDIAPSHVTSPALDIAFEGKLQYQGPKPSGSMTVHAYHFDKTMAALKALGPAIEKQAAPVLAMAKGLAKTESDGSLTWVAELGPDGAIKVNGLPLGKAPI